MYIGIIVPAPADGSVRSSPTQSHFVKQHQGIFKFNTSIYSKISHWKGTTDKTFCVVVVVIA